MYSVISAWAAANPCTVKVLSATTSGATSETSSATFSYEPTKYVSLALPLSTRYAEACMRARSLRGTVSETVSGNESAPANCG